MNKNDGGSAFPIVEPVDVSFSVSPGMSLRDWFAGMAMQGILREDVEQDLPDVVMARAAYSIADAMIAERDR